MSKILSTRPNGSLSVRLSYEVERGALEPVHQLERMRALVNEVAALEIREEEWERDYGRFRGHAEEHKDGWHEGCALCG